MRFTPGQTFDRYVIESLLGVGGMGEVYQAQDTRLGRKAALKVLRAMLPGDGESWGHAVARMQREARSMGMLEGSAGIKVFNPDANWKPSKP